MTVYELIQELATYGANDEVSARVIGLNGYEDTTEVDVCYDRVTRLPYIDVRIDKKLI